MGGANGYLVVYTQNQHRIATLYDEYLNYIADMDPDTEDAITQMNSADQVEGLHNQMWEEVLGELTPQEREEALVFHLHGEPEIGVSDKDKSKSSRH